MLGRGDDEKVAVSQVTHKCAEALPNLTEDALQMEHETLGELQAVVRKLDRVVEAIIGRDDELAAEVGDEGSADRRCKLLQERLLAALASHPAASDLLMLTSLLHVVGCLRRIERECMSMARLGLTARPAVVETSALSELVKSAAALAVSGVWLARAAFASRDVELAHEVIRLDAELSRRSNVIFRRALELFSSGEPEWAMSMLLVGSHAERVSDAAVDIAEQTVTVVNGLYRGVDDPDALAREPASTV